jgi:hypothetical protein
MKKLIVVILFCSVFSSFASAQVHFDTGQVYQVTWKNSDIQGINRSFVELTGFESAGGCPKAGNLIRAIIPSSEDGKNFYSMILAASMAKMDLNISVDDSAEKNDEGYCYIRNLRIWPNGQ